MQYLNNNFLDLTPIYLRTNIDIPHAISTLTLYVAEQDSMKFLLDTRQ
jgi:hypothetical protein